MKNCSITNFTNKMETYYFNQKYKNTKESLISLIERERLLVSLIERERERERLNRPVIFRFQRKI
jgi:hypothetical protein